MHRRTPQLAAFWICSHLQKQSEQPLTHLAVLAATGNTSGVPFHTLAAKEHGASRQEVISAVLLGLPAAGATVIAALPAAMEAYDGHAQTP